MADFVTAAAFARALGVPEPEIHARVDRGEIPPPVFIDEEPQWHRWAVKRALRLALMAPAEPLGTPFTGDDREEG